MAVWIGIVNIFKHEQKKIWIKQYFAEEEIEMKEYDQNIKILP